MQWPIMSATARGVVRKKSPFLPPLGMSFTCTLYRKLDDGRGIYWQERVGRRRRKTLTYSRGVWEIKFYDDGGRGDVMMPGRGGVGGVERRLAGEKWQ